VKLYAKRHPLNSPPFIQSGPYREGQPIKKPPFPQKERRFPFYANQNSQPADLVSISSKFAQGTQIHRVPVARTHREPRFATTCKTDFPQMYNQLRAGFLTCALPWDSFPSANCEQWIKLSLGFPTSRPEQTLTAARPSRTWTEFPFDYPEAKTPRDPQLDYFLFKEHSSNLLPNRTV